MIYRETSLYILLVLTSISNFATLNNLVAVYGPGDYNLYGRRANFDDVSGETRAQIYVDKSFRGTFFFLKRDVMECVIAYLVISLFFNVGVNVCLRKDQSLAMIVYVLLMTAMVASQCVLTGLHVTRDSVWHAKIKGELLEEMKLDYNETSSNDFSVSLNQAQYLYQCCGINGIEDFGDHLPPKSCCKIDVLRNEKAKCINAIEKDPVFSVVGCYTRIQENVVESRGAIFTVVAVAVLIEMIMIIAASDCVVLEIRERCKSRNDRRKNREPRNRPTQRADSVDQNSMEDNITISYVTRINQDDVKNPDVEPEYAVVRIERSVRAGGNRERNGGTDSARSF